MNGNGIPKHIVYKSYDNLKKELGNKYDTYMYKLNLDLTTRIDEATEYVEKFIPIAPDTYVFREAQVNHILNILKGDTIERERERERKAQEEKIKQMNEIKEIRKEDENDK